MNLLQKANLGQERIHRTLAQLLILPTFFRAVFSPSITFNLDLSPPPSPVIVCQVENTFPTPTSLKVQNVPRSALRGTGASDDGPR